MNFTWKRKRKAEDKVLRQALKLFEDDAEDADEELIRSGEIDWLCPVKRKCFQLEDSIVKSDRLKNEGCLLGEEGRFWEALTKFSEAVMLTPDSEVLHELMAQAFMQLNEVFPAVSMAEKAVRLKNNWWIAHQTLGRAQLGIGEVQMALTSFKKAIHLNPDAKELWEEDLAWALHLFEKKKNVTQNVEPVTEQEYALDILKDNDSKIAKKIKKKLTTTHALIRN